MGYESRGDGKQFLYLKVRLGNRVRSVYAGSGEVADTALAAHKERLAARRAQRLELRAELQRELDYLAELESQVVSYWRLVDVAFRKGMLSAGFYLSARTWHRRHFRRTPVLKSEQLREAIEAEQARRLFDADPTDELIDQHGGNLAKRLTELLLASKVPGHRQREAIRRRMAKMREELIQPGRSAIEIILVERVLVGWLDVHLCDLEAVRRAALEDQPIAFADHADRLRNRAQRRLLQATRALETIRNRAIVAIAERDAAASTASAGAKRNRAKESGAKNRISRHFEPAVN